MTSDVDRGREAAAPSTPHRLLLVEDEFLIRLMLTETLVDAGYDVVEAADADEALARLAVMDRPPAVLLTDVQLPGPIDGHALVRRVRGRLPALPVIFMTGRPEVLPGGAARREIMIAKPYHPSDVTRAVATLLGEQPSS